MFVVDDVLISDAVPRARFACDLSACHGACCVQGAGGAPLEANERAVLERLLPVVAGDLRPTARAAIARRGVWEETTPGTYATTCVEREGAQGENADPDASEPGACVFVTYDGPVALCSLQKAHQDGRFAGRPDAGFPKPISCHLFPLRIERHGDREVINYEQVSLCAAARAKGGANGTALADFARAPLIRRYGRDWYARFRAACAQRPAATTPSDISDHS